MPVYWLTSVDGRVNFKCQASNVPEAYELMARSLRYDGFGAMIADTGLSPSDFQVAMLQVEEAVYDHEGNRRLIDRQQDTTLTGAFRQLLSRRNA